jgi:radical SAM superfamily enzyme YgiQ (UPF0313 family)
LTKDRKLLLINPAMATGGRRKTSAGGMATMEPLGLAYVAAVTPPRWEVRIVDEMLEEIPADYEPDLVGLTALTMASPRAYEIARRYRQRGIKVVMGGMHASAMPDEAAQFVDVVFRGEAEGAWTELIRDFEAGQLGPRYDGRAATLSGLPLPRRDLYRRRYLVRLVSASRGCRYRCEYCSLWKVDGGSFRTRPPDEVLDELEAAAELSFPQSWSRWPVFFTDENMYTDREWSLALFRGMVDRGLKRPYAAQACVNVTEDDEMLAALKSSGCMVVLIGFESVSEESLRVMRKGVNLKVGVAHYRDRISRLHDHGLLAFGSFMFGNDGDGRDIFDHTAEFVLEAGLDMTYLGILTPYPGTDLHSRLTQENRLLYTDYPADYSRYDTNAAVFRPLRMTPEELEEGLVRAANALGARSAAARRAWDTFRRTGDPLVSALIYRWHRSGLYRRITEEPRNSAPVVAQA